MLAPSKDPHKEAIADYAPVTGYIHPHSVNSGVPDADIPLPQTRGEFQVDEAILEAFPIAGTKLKTSHLYGSSLWGMTAKLATKLPDGTSQNYFLKVLPNDNPGMHMCRGEYESLKAIRAVVPSFVPEVYKWGALKVRPGYFMLAEFRDVGQQPPDPRKFTMRVAELHRNSISPDGKFGFHVPTFHGNLPTYNNWESSWTVLFTKILARAMDLDEQRHGPWPEFTEVRRLLFNKVIPRLLDPLQREGRSIKPCLVHGDLWDENCATDMSTGEPFTFDSGALYAHNEYEIGYWRPPRHRLSNKAYIRAYKRCFPVSEPADEWDDRNLLYSMRYNIGCSVLIPSSGQRNVVLEDMKILCKKYYPQELNDIEGSIDDLISESIPDKDDLEVEDDYSMQVGLAELDMTELDGEGNQNYPTMESIKNKETETTGKSQPRDSQYDGNGLMTEIKPRDLLDWIIPEDITNEIPNEGKKISIQLKEGISTVEEENPSMDDQGETTGLSMEPKEGIVTEEEKTSMADEGETKDLPMQPKEEMSVAEEEKTSMTGQGETKDLSMQLKEEMSVAEEEKTSMTGQGETKDLSMQPKEEIVAEEEKTSMGDQGETENLPIQPKAGMLVAEEEKTGITNEVKNASATELPSSPPDLTEINEQAEVSTLQAHDGGDQSSTFVYRRKTT